MSPRVRYAMALGLLAAATALGFVALRRPPPTAVPEAPTTSPSPRASHAPARSLPPPSSRTPESIARGALSARSPEGPITTLVVTTPAFEITRRYRSMEGPYAEYDVRVDGGGATQPRELWWWKGARIEMLDERGEPQDQEFMCHLNVDVDPIARRKMLGVKQSTKRLLTLTQGEIAFALPEGRGVPVASDETWHLMFQVLNHNRDGAFRVKQRLVLDFVRDADRTGPIAAVQAFAGSIWVPLDEVAQPSSGAGETACSCCAPLVQGMEATNGVMAGRFVDEAGRTLAGHWIVPPGKGSWSYPMSGTLGPPDKPRRLYATWTHVHPFATEVRLVAHEAEACEGADAGPAHVIASSSIESLRDGRIGVASIRSFKSAEGVPLPDKAVYEIAVDYDNTSGKAQDSMTSLGMFVGVDWPRPAWAP